MWCVCIICRNVAFFELPFKCMFVCDICECVGKSVPELSTIVEYLMFFSCGRWERKMKFVCLPCVMCVYLTVCGEIVCEIWRKVVIEVVVHK